jgi:hypothetical protein
LQVPLSLGPAPSGFSHLLEAHTLSLLHAEPFAMGGLHTGGSMARMQTVPLVHSASGSLAEAPHLTSSAKDTCDKKDIDTIIAIDNKSLLNIFLSPFAVNELQRGFLPIVI